ncbi:unnamed protein product [Euphydryas editha]|uniref:HTH CENPB-type domain-containing protein n=1 Tax=Euphydryas editha TaxID=104508 RepID=A0AAU9US74_EUPED|nr:unnamed protein product [Euphydryas editha]
MPRKYIRKTETRYKIEDLRRAVEEVKNKRLTLGKAAAQFSIPKTTLFKQLKETVVKTPKKGRYAVFNYEQEQQLEKYIIECCKSFYGITPSSLRRIAFRFAEANKLKHNFNKSTQLAGKDWYYGFMARHPSISLRMPEATSLNRITAFNATEVNLFFDQLKMIQTKHNIPGHRIFNVDETGISTVQKNYKVLAPKGLKQIGKATSGERGVTTTVVCAVSASGIYVPPMFIFKRKRMNELLVKGCNNDMVATISDSGWINESIFIDYLRHFISFVKPTKEDPVLLILDNHESHISLGAYELFREHGLHVLSLPPHVSHKMQPLDLTIFSSLKMAYNKECELYMVNNPGKRISQYEVGELFTKAFNKTANISKAISGFRAAGIYPIDPDRFKDSFECSLYDQTDISQTQTSGISEATTAQNLAGPVDTAKLNQTPPMQISQDTTITSIPENDKDVSVTTVSTPVSSTPVPLSKVTNMPVIPHTRTTSTRQNKKHAQILSSSPLKTQLEEKQKRQSTRNYKKEKSPTKKTEKKKVPKKVSVKDKEIKILKKVVGGNENNEEYFCIICNDKYESPPTEDWIMCSICELWAHEQCTTGETNKGFVCDLCHGIKL